MTTSHKAWKKKTLQTILVGIVAIKYWSSIVTSAIRYSDRWSEGRGILGRCVIADTSVWYMNSVLNRLKGVYSVSHGSNWTSTTEGVREQPKWYNGCITHNLNQAAMMIHDGVIKWKHFPRYWSFALGIHRSPVNSPHKGQWRGALMFSLICTWINGWVNKGEAGDLRRHRARYDVTAMSKSHIERVHEYITCHLPVAAFTNMV